jgi:cyclophilin family peptidyl-prolyl cis-trans isomerase
MKIRLFLLSALLLLLMACNQNPSTPPKDKEPRIKVKLRTNLGDMVIELFNETPAHRDNFLKLVDQRFYDSLLIHFAQLNNIVIGGAPDSKGAKPDHKIGMINLDYELMHEIDTQFVHIQGAVGAYHFGKDLNPERKSTASQFYIVHGFPIRDYQFAEIEAKNGFKYTQAQKDLYRKYGGVPYMDRQFTLFGQVVEGLGVLERMVSMPSKPNVFGRPVEDIVILGVERL